MRPIWHDTITLDGTKFQLHDMPCRQVDIRAGRTNAALIYLGTEDGQPWQLPNGEVIYTPAVTSGLDFDKGEPHSIPCTNANQIWFDGTSGDTIRYTIYR